MTSGSESAHAATGADRRSAAVTLACMAATIAAANFWTGREFRTPVAASVAPSPVTSFVTLDRAADPPPPPFVGEGPALLLLGNSHTYTLPSPTPGEPMVVRDRGILPDELGKKLGGNAPVGGVYLLSYPNFLPYEMLTRSVQLQAQNYRPRIVVLGLTWRNVAREVRLRDEVFSCFRDPSFAAEFRQALAKIDPADAAPILQAITGDVRRLAREQEAERMKSHANRIDEQLFDEARRHVALIGYGVDLRTRIYKLLVGSVQRSWEERKSIAYSYELIPADLEFNQHCLRALLQSYLNAGSQVVIYYAPERDDLPPMMDPAQQADFIRSFDDWCQARGVSVVDARRVVPNEHWGYDLHTPDRSHFTETGHRLLAEFLIDRAEPLRRAAADRAATERAGAGR